MDLKEFLLLIFDKNVDRYPEIRYCFMRSWNVSEIINILAITNYRCSRNEFCRYIEYSCLEKGIDIISNFRGIRCNIDISQSNIPDDSVAPRQHLYNIFHPYTLVTREQENDLPINVWIRSCNSEFLFIMGISYKIWELEDDEDNIVMNILAKAIPKYSINRKSICPPSEYTISLKTQHTDKEASDISAIISKFCELMTMSPIECRKYCILQEGTDQAIHFISTPS
jgi:hypothetical protein